MAARESGATQACLAAGQGHRAVDRWLELLAGVIEAADRLGVLAP